MPRTNEGWKDVLTSDALSTASTLSARVKKEVNEGFEIFPPYNDIFKALCITHPQDVKVVIIGQDAYHEKGQANGLAFSVNKGIKIPPSLVNVFKELNSDLGIEVPEVGDLTPWATQGVLLLNTVLTVYEGRANSCVDWGWQDFTRDVMRACLCLPQPIVFIVWGKQARVFLEEAKSLSNITDNKFFIYSSHPSPLGAYKASKNTVAFIGSRPFSRANIFLTSAGVAPIDWNLN